MPFAVAITPFNCNTLTMERVPPLNGGRNSTAQWAPDAHSGCGRDGHGDGQGGGTNTWAGMSCARDLITGRFVFLVGCREIRGSDFFAEIADATFASHEEDASPAVAEYSR